MCETSSAKRIQAASLRVIAIKSSNFSNLWVTDLADHDLKLDDNITVLELQVTHS